MKSKTEEQKSKYPLYKLVRHMYGYIFPYRSEFWKGTYARIFGDVMSLIPAYVISETINILSSEEKNYQRILFLFSFWLFAIFARSVAHFYGKVKIYSLEERVRRDLEVSSLRSAFALSAEWHEKENSGNKLKRMLNGADGAKRILHIWVVNLIEIAVGFVGVTIVLFHYNPLISLFGLFYISSSTFIGYILNKRPTRAAKLVNEVDEETTGLFFESINNIRTVKILNIVEVILQKAFSFASERFRRIKKRIFLFQIRSQALGLWGSLCRFTGASYCVWQVILGHQQVGFVALFIMYFNRLWELVTELSEVSPEIVIAKQQIFRMRESFHDVPLTRPEETKSFPKEWKTISVKDVSFAYAEENVLKKVSFEVKRGEKIGIVGLSGAGKSTLFKLLLKERNHMEGTISIEGVPINEIKNDDYLAHVSVVLQDTEVFNMSLRDNVTIVRPDVEKSESLLDRALTVSHVKDFLPKLHDGVNTIIGEKGVKLSGGERQRLGIARAIFKEPDILLMDEATSHLDIESEKKIQASLHEFFRGVTAIVIAHRLTTIKEMDKILVIEHGKIIEAGSFNELYARKGRFFELWEKQQL